MKKTFALLLAMLTLCLPAFAEETPDKEKGSLYELLSSAEHFTIEYERIFTLRSPDAEATTAQGGCTDGTYHYQAFMRNDKASSERENPVLIVKSDLETGKFIAKSDIHLFNHASDLTYNPNTNQLVICHSIPFKEKLSFMDPETLEYIETISLPCKIFGIDYNASRDKYVVGMAGGQNFRILNGDFTYDSPEYRGHPETKSSTTQAMCCSDDLICFALYKKNVVSVFDWEGNPLCVIHLNGLDMAEPENIMIIDEEIYMTFIVVPKVAVFYKITPVPITQ